MNRLCTPKRLFTTAIAGLLGAATLTVATFAHQPSIALAQSPDIFEELELTDTQRSELETIFSTRRAEVQALLSEEQQAAFAAALEADPGNFRAAFQAVDLSDDQRAEVREIMTASRDDIADVLTDEQRQQLREAMQERHRDRGGSGRRGDIVQALASLDLSAAQRGDIETIFANSRAELEALLSAEQRTAFQTTFADTQNFRAAVEAANLTADQRDAARDIMRSAREDIAAVLTDEQLEQLQSARGDRRGPGGQGFRRRGQGPASRQ
jgi:Spy/CpxP family protein refolding chaperone